VKKEQVQPAKIRSHSGSFRATISSTSCPSTNWMSFLHQLASIHKSIITTQATLGLHPLLPYIERHCGKPYMYRSSVASDDPSPAWQQLH
jgi:hypothetical protein